MDAGCDGLIVCGSLGEGPMLTLEEHRRPQDGPTCCCRQAGADDHQPHPPPGSRARWRKRPRKRAPTALWWCRALSIRPTRRKLLPRYAPSPEAADLPVMIYSNRVAYCVDVTPQIMEELASDKRFVAIKDRRTIFGAPPNLQSARRPLPVLTGVDNLAFEALVVGAVGWVAGLGLGLSQGDSRDLPPNHRKVGSTRRSRSIAGSGRCSTSMSAAILFRTSNSRKRSRSVPTTASACPQPLSGEVRARVEKIVRDAIATRPALPPSYRLLRGTHGDQHYGATARSRCDWRRHHRPRQCDQPAG